MRTYTSVITSLFSKSLSLARARAWDLFFHMRYGAHPQPDALLYTLMIRACASPISPGRSSEPEHALDLWTKMTVDRRIMPNSRRIQRCYPCMRKVWAPAEAFRLAKEMLNSYRDSEGRDAFRPDSKTFCALLEGAKHVGDPRTRWILVEMARAGPNGCSPTGEVMHMWHTSHHSFGPLRLLRRMRLAKLNTTWKLARGNDFWSYLHSYSSAEQARSDA